MAGVIENIFLQYNYLIHNLADPRTNDWFGVSNPLFILTLLSAYLYFCKSFGPKFMSKRKPFELKTTLVIYNLFNVLFSIFLAYEGASFVFHKDYNLACEEVDYSNNPRAIRIAAAAWYYYIAKILELFDTVFFILRKKFNQVSFLHVYHHTLMSLTVWYGVKYFAGGHLILMGFLNSIVHIIMYTYYLISGLGPEYQKYVWWKKYVTVIQLIQFCIVFVHNIAVFFYKCDYPKILNIAACSNALAFIYMFGKFYWNSYNRNSKNKIQLEKKDDSLTIKVKEYNARRKVVEKTR